MARFDPDAAGLAAAYREHRDWVVALAYRMTGDRDDALDVLQDVFLWLFGRVPVELTGTLRSFLYPAIKHRCIDRARRRRKVVTLRFALDFQLDEIAAALAIPLGTVKSRLHYALVALRP